MKQGIHPNYYKAKVICTSCGAEFETGSTLKEIRVDSCSNCHPFYTGAQGKRKKTGKIEQFNRKYNINKD